MLLRKDLSNFLPDGLFSLLFFFLSNLLSNPSGYSGSPLPRGEQLISAAHSVGQAQVMREKQGTKSSSTCSSPFQSKGFSPATPHFH